MKIEIKILNKEFYSSNATEMCPEGYPDYLPRYATPGSAAMDLMCTEDVVLYPGETKMISTGLAIHIGSGCRNYASNVGFEDEHVVGLILPRSGLGTKGLILATTVGVIDEDYQGELMVQAWNRNNKFLKALGNEHKWTYNDIILKAGDRFAQLMFVPVIKCSWNIVENFSNTTSRGSNGFGSSGK